MGLDSVELVFVFLMVTRPLKKQFPQQAKLFGDLLDITWQYSPRCSLERVRRSGYSREAIHREVALIVADQLGVNPDECIEDARYIEDLGMA